MTLNPADAEKFSTAEVNRRVRTDNFIGGGNVPLNPVDASNYRQPQSIAAFVRKFFGR